MTGDVVGSHAQVGAAAVADDRVAGNLAQGDSRCVYGYRHALAGGGGADHVIGIHGCRNHYRVGGGGFRINADACAIAVFDSGIARTPSVGERASVGSIFNGEGSALSALADGHVGHVVKGDGRSVHSHRHFLGFGFGAGVIAGAHCSRSHYGVSGVFSGIDSDACIMLIVNGDIALFPFVGDSAIGIISNGGNAEFCAAAVTDSGLASDVVKRNRRSVHIHGETLGVGGGAVADGSCYLHSINGGVAGVDIDACAIAVLDSSAARTPSVGKRAVGAVRSGSDGEGGSVSIGLSTDGGACGLDVGEDNGRRVHGYLHALAGGDGAGVIAFAYSGSGHHTVGGVFSGIDGDGAGRLLGVPYVGNSPFGASSGADGKFGFIAGTDGSGAGNLIQHNSRCIHIHGEALGGGGGAGVLAFTHGGRGFHSVSGGVGGGDGDGGTAFLVDNAGCYYIIASFPYKSHSALSAVSNGSNAEFCTAAVADGRRSGDVAQLD